MKYKIENYPHFRGTGLKYKIKPESAFETIPEIWKKAKKDGTIKELSKLFMQTDYRPDGLLGIPKGGHFKKVTDMEYYLAVTTFVEGNNSYSELEIPKGMARLDFPSCAWLIIDASKIPFSKYKDIYIFAQEYLRTSEYKEANLPAIECYIKDNREVWIPIVSCKDNN
jgi:AraC family transcriptional regulator